MALEGMQVSTPARGRDISVEGKRGPLILWSYYQMCLALRAPVGVLVRLLDDAHQRLQS